MENAKEILLKQLQIVFDCDEDDAKKILSGKYNPLVFDKVLGEGKLELLRARVEFFSKTEKQANEEKDPDLKPIILGIGIEQIQKAIQALFFFLLSSYEQNLITKKYLYEKSHNFLETLQKDKLESKLNAQLTEYLAK